MPDDHTSTGETEELTAPEVEVSSPNVEGGGSNTAPPPSGDPLFIVYMTEPQFTKELLLLSQWVHGLLLPVYGRETTSAHPWCPEWWLHTEAVAQLHGLWLAWQFLTRSDSEPTGPANWHRDFLGPTMTNLRSPDGPFAGCKMGAHRDKEIPLSVEIPAPPQN